MTFAEPNAKIFLNGYFSSLALVERKSLTIYENFHISKVNITIAKLKISLVSGNYFNK